MRLTMKSLREIEMISLKVL
jgi:hypothetical protein